MWTRYFFEFGIKCLTLWHVIQDWSFYGVNGIKQFGSYLADYYRDHHNTWVLLKGHSLPLSMQHIDPSHPHLSPSWLYYSRSNTAYHANHSLATNETYTLRWLSAEIYVKQDELVQRYSMDDFLESFTIHTLHHLPTLHDVFQMWCIKTKHWFSLEHDVKIQIIDSDGVDYVVAADSDKSFIVDGHKLAIDLNPPQADNKN